MATVETKIKLFEIMVIEKKLNDERKRLEEVNREYQERLAAVQAECQESMKTYLSEIKAKGKADQERLLMQAEVEGKKQILAKRGELLERIQDDFAKRLESFSKGETYQAYFLDRFKTAAKAFQKEELLVGLHPKDLAYIDQAYETRTDETIAGGFYLIHKGAVKYDYTWNREIENVRGYFGQAVSALLQTVEEETRGE